MNINDISSNSGDTVEQLRQEKIIKDAPYYRCERCNGLNFIQAFRYKKISGLLDGSGQDKRLPIAVVVCADCGTVPKEYLERIENNPDSKIIK